MNNEREVYAVAVVKSKAKPYLFDIEIANNYFKSATIKCAVVVLIATSRSVSHCRVSEKCRLYG